jgi:carbon storage regulator
MGEKVRIGIQAPHEVPVFRKEIYLEIHSDGQDAQPAERGARADVDDALRELGESS